MSHAYQSCLYLIAFSLLGLIGGGATVAGIYWENYYLIVPGVLLALVFGAPSALVIYRHVRDNGN